MSKLQRLAISAFVKLKSTQVHLPGIRHTALQALLDKPLCNRNQVMLHQQQFKRDKGLVSEDSSLRCFGAWYVVQQSGLSL